MKDIYCWLDSSFALTGIFKKDFIEEIFIHKIKETNKFFCWGNNENGILGIENTTISSIKVPKEIISLRNISISSIVTGWNHTIILSGKQIFYF